MECKLEKLKKVVYDHTPKKIYRPNFKSCCVSLTELREGASWSMNK